MEGFEETSNG
jgi:hypothetical protein